MEPTSPFDNPIVRDTSGQYTLLIDRENFSFGGSECNKIGTSYEAFNNQPSGCDRPVQSCLDNQIADLIERDAERMRNGQSPLNILKHQGDGWEFRRDSMGRLELSMPVKEVQTSLIRLELETQGKITFVKMIANGQISDLQLVNNEFEALSGHGTVFITLQNIDIIVGEFGIWVECDDLTVVP